VKVPARVRVGAWALLLCGLTGSRADAHRLDELLQGAYVAVAADQIRVTVSLNPGALTAGWFVAAVDRDGDRRFSPAERQAFTADVVRQLQLSIDQKPAPLTLDSSTFDSIDALEEGTGRVEIHAVAPAPGGGAHTLALINGFEPARSVYAMNALRPETPRLVITQQSRDPQQRTLRVEYAIRPRWMMAAPLVGSVMVTGLFLLITQRRSTWLRRTES
jgi:hypothetical protein